VGLPNPFTYFGDAHGSDLISMKRRAISDGPSVPCGAFTELWRCRENRKGADCRNNACIGAKQLKLSRD
jgi:hypothetical protein